MLKIVEMKGFDIPFGDRERIDGVTCLEEARDIVKNKLMNEGDQAFYNPTDGFLIFKGVGGPGENRCMEFRSDECYYYLATHGTILWALQTYKSIIWIYSFYFFSLIVH